MSSHGEAALVELARAQHGVVSRQQLLALGLTRRVVARRVRHQRLQPLHRGVYLVGVLPVQWTREMAALLACGPRAVLSHWSAARVWGLPVPDQEARDVVDVTVPPSGSGRRPGVRAHRVGGLHRTEVRLAHGMRVTTAARTLFDLAAPLGRAGGTRRLEQLVAVALDQRLATDAELRALLARHASHRGAGLLRLMLESRNGPALARSEAEERLLELLRSAGVECPRSNARLGVYEVDLLWEAERLVVEVDGYAWHSSRNRFEGDRTRDVTLTSAGYTLLRFTWRQLVETPDAVVARIAFMLGRLSRA